MLRELSINEYPKTNELKQSYEVEWVKVSSAGMRGTDSHYRKQLFQVIAVKGGSKSC